MNQINDFLVPKSVLIMAWSFIESSPFNCLYLSDVGTIVLDEGKGGVSIFEVFFFDSINEVFEESIGA